MDGLAQIAANGHDLAVQQALKEIGDYGEEEFRRRYAAGAPADLRS